MSRRSLLIAWWVATAAVAVVVVARLGDWNEAWSWPRASSIADGGVIYGGPVLAAAACWIQQRRRAHRPPELLSAMPRPQWVQRTGDLGSLLNVAAAVAVTAHLGAWIPAWINGAHGTPRWQYVALTTVVLGLCVVVGYVVALLSPLRIASAFVALALLLVMLVWVDPNGMPLWSVINGWPQVTVSGAALTARVVLLGLAVGAVVLCTVRRPLRTAMCLAATGSALVVVAGAGSPLAPAVPTSSVCTDNLPTVCLWPDNAGYLPQMSAAADAARVAVADTLALPAEPVIEEGLGYLVQGGSTDRAVAASAVTVRFGAGEMVFSLVNAWLDQAPSCSAPVDPGERDVAAGVMWRNWVLGRVAEASDLDPGLWELTDAQTAELARVQDQPESEQVRWATATAARAQGCTG
ncbi:hypothetical protein [Cellulomonas hominis]